MEITREFVQELYKRLNSSIIQVRFTKADGTERIMNCTLQPDIVPWDGIPADILEDTENYSNVVVCWDTDISAWRSFRLDRLIHVE